ncbi:MAG: hypothetical protein WBA25_12880, partial [Jannaschia sp.]
MGDGAAPADPTAPAAAPDFDTLAALLTNGETQRVWSVVITVFGDLARAEGKEIGSPVLHALGAGMGLRPEAIRTALHRLRKEGWLDGRRQGRHGYYTLTEWGRAQSDTASPRIYGPQAADRAFLVVDGPEGAPRIAVAPGMT